MPPLPQDNAHHRPRAKNPMNLTINTSGEIPAGANNKTKPDSGNELQPPQLPNRFPLDSPILVEIPSPDHSSGSEKGSRSKPKLVNAGLGGALAGGSKGESLNLHADSALSKTEFERAIRARLEQGTKATRNMGSTTQQQQQRPAGLQLLTEFSRDDAQSEQATFLDLSDLKSIANAREKERLREHNSSSSHSLQQPVHERAEELSPSDRPIMIGLTVPYDESTPRTNTATAGETIDSASSRTPATPSIVVTPAREHPPWHMDMHMDMSTSPEMLHRPRAASSIYSQPSPKPMYDEDAPPVPAIPAFHSVTSFDHHNQRPVSTGTEFEGEEQVSSNEKVSSPTTTRRNMKKKLLHKLSVNTSDANRPESQGWWTYLLSPLLSRSNTVSSRRTALSPQQHQTRSARSPLSAVSFSKALSPRQPTTTSEEGESSTHWWDDEKIAIPPEKSHFSPDTPEDLTRHVPPIMGGMPFHNDHVTATTSTRAMPDDEKGNKTRSVFQIGDEMVPNYEFHGARAEYYQASAHDLYDKENPYFECINHVCSMTSAKRRAEIEAAEKAAEERMEAEIEKGGGGGLAVFVFDPSRDANNPFIAFLEKRVDVKDVVVDGDEKDDGNGEKREVESEEVEKTGLSNARELLSFDSSDEDEEGNVVDEKGHTSSRGLSQSPDLGPSSRSVASFSPPLRSRYEPSVSLPPPVEERGVAQPPAPASVSLSREMSPPPAPAPIYAPPAPMPAPAPAPVAAPPPVQMPMMPPPQPHAFYPEPVPMPMPPPPQPRAFSPEPVAMPMPPPAPVQAPAPLPPREPVPMPMPASRPPPVDERAPVTMPAPQPPSDDTIRGIPGGYQWEPAPVARAMSPPRPTRVVSPPIPPAAPVPMSQSREVEESTSRLAPSSERDAEPPIPRPAPSFSRPGPFSAPRRVPQPPAPTTPQQSATDAPADESDAESVLPPYSRNAPRQPGLPTYSARNQPEYRDRAPVAPGPVSPGLQQAMTSRGGIPMSDVSQRTHDMDLNDTASISRSGEPGTIINVHHYYNGEHPRDAPEPPRAAGNQFVSEADLQSRNENEARRQRLEKEDNIAKKVGGLWRGRGCIPKKGCFGRGGREGRTRRRWYAAIIAFCILVIVLSISLATTLTRKGDGMSVESEWLNITGFPPIPTGIMTVAGPAPAVERSSCIAPTSVWSCALPPEQQASNAGGYAPDAPNFRIEIRFRNDSSLLSNSTASSNSTATTKRSWGGIFRRDDWTASPAAPRLVDQIFLGNTTDNVTTPFQGEDTPFYITFLSPVDVANASAEYVKRDVVSSTGTAASIGTESATTATHSATGTGTGIATGTASSGTKTSTKTATGTQTHTGTSTSTSTSTSEINVANLIPAPDLASDGTAAAATLYPLPVQQPIKLYNRGLPTEHYGFFTYFDKSIFLASDASITGGTTDTDSRDAKGGSTETEASVRCTWSQTRFLVQIWTQPQNVTHMSLSAISNTTATSSSSTTSATAATASSTSGSIATSSANNFTSPGSFPYPITITIDRHGGIATEKLAYCYGIEQQNSTASSSGVAGTYYNLTNPKLQAEQRDSGGSVVSPSPNYFVIAAALADGATADQESPIDGGTGGCMCEWRNWIETH